MTTTASLCLVSTALAMAASALGDTVAVSPCILGPDVPAKLGLAVTDRVVKAASEISGIRVADRSLTHSVIQEQDLLIVSRAADVLPHRFGDIGAEQILVTGLLETSAGFSLSLRLIDVATGEVLKAAVHQTPGQRDLLRNCEAWTKALWEATPVPSAQGKQNLSVSGAIASLWNQLDRPRVRHLIGPDLDRADSVYRQYVKAVQAGASRKAERLAQLAGVYLTDCLSLLQRATDPPDGMVYVPPGRVVVPVSSVKTRRFHVRGFFIDRCEYTRGQYARFLKSTGRAKPLGWSDPTPETAKLPVVGIDWHDAAAAAAWRGLALPTYPQYLRAVMGERRRKYPWGDLWRAEICNHARSPGRAALEPVGGHPDNASQYGVLDGVGNVAEWLDTWQDTDYWTHAPSRNPRGPNQGSAKLVAGGSFRSGPGGCTCNSFQPLTPGTRKDDLGFRCVLPVGRGFGNPE